MTIRMMKLILKKCFVFHAATVSKRRLNCLLMIRMGGGQVCDQ